MIGNATAAFAQLEYKNITLAQRLLEVITCKFARTRTNED